MLQTQLGEKVSSWSVKAKANFKTDLDKLTKVPLKVLTRAIETISRTYPACNVVELATLLAEQSGIPDGQALSDVSSAFAFLIENIAGESPQVVTEDLISLGLLSNEAGRLLTDFLVSAQPVRESAQVAAHYLRIGSALFSTIRGTVDFRLRFHKTLKEFESRTFPAALVGAQQVIMADLTINQPDGEEINISFLMDENDLSYMKRFVTNMERELELSKDLLKQSEQKANG